MYYSILLQGKQYLCTLKTHYRVSGGRGREEEGKERERERERESWSGPVWNTTSQHNGVPVL